MSDNFTQHQVTFEGRHLEELYRYLYLNRVQTVPELDVFHAERLPPKTLVVMGVQVQTLRELHDAV